LIAEDAAKSLPNQITSILKDISKEFAHSQNKKYEFETIQQKLNLEVKSPKKWIDTRWLSLSLFLENFFNQLPAFEEYFKENDKNIYKNLNNKLNLAYIAFLKVMTEEFCIYNKLYQSDEANQYTLYTKSRKHFMDLFCIISDEKHCKLGFEEALEIFQNTEKYSMNNDEEFFTEIKLKTKKLIDLKCLSANQKKDFLKGTRAYIQSTLQAMIKRLPLDHKIINHFKVLNFQDFSRSSWIKLIEAFPNIIDDENKALNELSNLRDLILNKKFTLHQEDEKGKNLKQEYDVLYAWKSFERNYGKEFPNITKLGTSILAFPTSTASVEREFKQLKAIKTLNRTSLKEETLDSILIAKDMITEDLISDKRFVNSIYSRYSALTHQDNIKNKEIVSRKK